MKRPAFIRWKPCCSLTTWLDARISQQLSWTQQITIDDINPLVEIPNLDHHLSTELQPNPFVTFRDTFLTDTQEWKHNLLHVFCGEEHHLLRSEEKHGWLFTARIKVCSYYKRMRCVQQSVYVKDRRQVHVLHAVITLILKAFTPHHWEQSKQFLTFNTLQVPTFRLNVKDVRATVLGPVKVSDRKVSDSISLHLS